MNLIACVPWRLAEAQQMCRGQFATARLDLCYEKKLDAVASAVGTLVWVAPDSQIARARGGVFSAVVPFKVKPVPLAISSAD
ncbi:MAG: hypothetical protein FJ271_04445 [Planctomycetes bacterium]|nr:hypothetical protein [Planctomycetota bacterium]